MDAAAPTPPPIVDSDRPCIRCGYSLRGLPTSVACPECGTPVQRTLSGDLLAYCDPAYLRTLRRGAEFIMASIVALLLVIIAGSVINATDPTGPGVFAYMAYIQLIGLLIVGAFLLGWWLFTAPDSGQLTTNKGERPRIIVRTTVLLAAAIKLSTLVIPLITKLPQKSVAALALLDLIAVLVGYYAGMLYVRWLAPRIPSDTVNGRAVNLMVLLTSVLAVIVLMAGLAPAIGGAGPLAIMVGVVAIILCGVALTTYYNLFSSLRQHLIQFLARHLPDPGVEAA